MKSTEKLPLFEHVQLLRLIAATGVFLSHIGFGYYYADQIVFNAGVNLLFCISAFLMMYTTQTKRPGPFLKKRLVRLLPLYWVLTVATFAAARYFPQLGQGSTGAEDLIKSMLFLPYMRDGILSSDVVRPLIGPAWTLSHDIWFTVVFACMMKLSHKHRGILAGTLCVLVVVIGRILPIHWPTAIFMRRLNWLSYTAGIAVYYIWMAVKDRLPKQNPWALLWAIPSLVMLGTLYYRRKPVLVSVLLCFGILLCVILAFRGRTVPRPVKAFGRISYHFYLIHYYVIILLGFFLDFTVLSPTTWLGTALAFVMSVGCACISYLLLERKPIELLRRTNFL